MLAVFSRRNGELIVGRSGAKRVFMIVCLCVDAGRNNPVEGKNY